MAPRCQRFSGWTIALNTHTQEGKKTNTKTIEQHHQILPLPTTNSRYSAKASVLNTTSSTHFIRFSTKSLSDVQHLLAATCWFSKPRLCLTRFCHLTGLDESTSRKECANESFFGLVHYFQENLLNFSLLPSILGLANKQIWKIVNLVTQINQRLTKQLQLKMFKCRMGVL